MLELALNQQKMKLFRKINRMFSELFEKNKMYKGISTLILILWVTSLVLYLAFLPFLIITIILL